LDTSLYASVSVGDFVVVGTGIAVTAGGFQPNKIIAIEPNKIKLQNPTNVPSSFLMYKKNQNIDGSNIRGDVFEIEMTNNSTEKVELRAVNLEVVKSEIT